LKTTEFDYDLPPEYIAQKPIEPRDAARLLVLNRESGSVQHAVFKDLGRFLTPGDLLVLNETRVIPARLFARKVPSGGQVEVLLLRRQDPQTWEVMVGGKGMVAGKRFQVESGPQAEILAALDGPRRLVRFFEPLEPFLERAGHVPLPPYIHTPLQDPERYQTVYARQPGSAAAPTAGLHFTPRLIESLKSLGVRFAIVTLHVGLDTFAPVNEEDPQEHKIHTEWCQLLPETAQLVNNTHRSGGRIIAVGTTSVRTLESAARAAKRGETVGPVQGSTDLFILPGFKFQAVDAMITNFHLPRSTLIMLVSAFAGREQVLKIYELAKRENYRFYSFGDAMFIA
jgi:S-adenosylmethionine:tRNA ribosyltransferase-isomerase